MKKTMARSSKTNKDEEHANFNKDKPLRWRRA